MKYTTRYLFDPDTGEYKCEVPVPKGDGIIPPDNTTDAPPRPPAGFAAFRSVAAGKWEYAPDHRGATVYAKDLSGQMQIDSVGEIPDDCTLTPPLMQKQGFAVRWGAGGWEYAEDHRGTVGYVAGEKVTVEELGPLPEGFTTEAPPPPEPPPYVPPPDTRTAEEKRESAYRKEADPIARRIDGYRLEADALRLAGDEGGADDRETKAAALLADFLAVKQEIRERFPDNAAAPAIAPATTKKGGK